ncbi:MAG: endonuclease V, partial [Gammaproteobacteria bacterium]|nr:endonuclease V [Gammaproteobacteria bacterium]
MHRWKVTPRRAVEIQNDLRGKVRIAPLPPVSTVVGVDCAFGEEQIFATAVVWDVDGGAVMESRSLSRPLQFPYVPGLLSFREAPALIAVLRRVRSPFDAILCDGQGLAHPRRLGLACHLGVLLDKPAVGCAKSRLV